MLTVFPTKAALRRAELETLPDGGVRDVSRMTTLRALLERCERSARLQGVLRGRAPTDAELRLLMIDAAERAPLDPRCPPARLPLPSRAATLDLLIQRFAVFAGYETDCIDWLLAHPSTHPLHGAGHLLQTWLSCCREHCVADRFAVNRALLQMIESGDLPDPVRSGVLFRAVRWFNPFEERFVAALKRRLGPNRVRIESALPAAHAEAAEDRLCTLIRSELARGAEEEWRPWLEDFADAFETDDSNLVQSESRERISFFVAAGPYGEIEDAARRIAQEIDRGTAPERIALMVRNLGPFADIIPDVFERFAIPCHFRRGLPASAHPPVKILLTLLGAHHQRSRDRLCSLLQIPGIEWPGLDNAAKRSLLAEIRFHAPPVLTRLPSALRTALGPAPAPRCTIRAFARQARNAVERHALICPGEVTALLGELEAVPGPAVHRDHLLSLFENLLDNLTLRDEADTESGVWILNVHDAAGLRFDSVHLAGMDDRSFPCIPSGDPLLQPAERTALRTFFNERGIPCPRLALPDPGAELIQEEILFLTAISAARERLTLSFPRHDASGKECAPGEFFERMRILAGAGEPGLGASFHAILPPHLCRAEDEIRQTRARCTVRRESPAEAAASPAARANTARHIGRWMEMHPEFSPTELEALARNRLVFFLERILGMQPPRTREDHPDPMDRGSIIHQVLEAVYTDLAEQSGCYAVPRPNGDGQTEWMLSTTPSEKALPLAVFSSNRAEELMARAQTISADLLTRAARAPHRRLGHPAVWEAEQQKILQIVQTMLRVDLETAEAEHRFPALFEMPFGHRHGLPVCLDQGSDQVCLRGKIDRIDLVFSPDGVLDRVLVVDYKSPLHNESPGKIERRIALHLDCQMPVYLFAAQQRFFGTFNTPETLARSAAVYHLQHRETKTALNHFQKKRVCLSPDLSATFTNRLFENLHALRSGDLAAEPLIAGYDDWSHICRSKSVPVDELMNDDSGAEP